MNDGKEEAMAEGGAVVVVGGTAGMGGRSRATSPSADGGSS